MSTHAPVRILASRHTASRLGGAVADIMAGRPHEWLIAATTHAEAAPTEADLAFISRDVTGLSTKHVLVESLEAFYVSLRASPSLAWVQGHSAGADRPIFGELAARGVTVKMAGGNNAEVVVQSALAGILSLAREFPKLAAAQREHRWASLVGALPRDLAGQSAVIVGWGPIGQRIAAFLGLLGLTLTVVRHSAEPAGPDIATLAFGDIDSILPQADWLILACPLTPQTRGLLGADSLALLKPGARLINVARGEVVSEQAVIERLRSGALAGAYLDVFEHEPLSSQSPLWDLPNVILSPHSAGHSDGNEGRVDQIFLENLRRWLVSN
jgi:phosphoglycerate dehydrogenase-like enzyme